MDRPQHRRHAPTGGRVAIATSEIRAGVSLQASIEAIAKAVALTDVSDLPALVSLQEMLLRLGEEATQASLPAVSEVSAQAAELVEQLVLREIEDTTDAIRTLSAAIEYAQVADRCHERGEPLSGIRSPFDHSLPERSAARDLSLIPAWIDRCNALRGSVGPSLALLRPDRPDLELLKGIEDHFRGLADESLSVGLDSAARLSGQVADAIDRGITASDLADLLTWSLSWLEDAARRLGEDPAAALPSIESKLTRRTASGLISAALKARPNLPHDERPPANLPTPVKAPVATVDVAEFENQDPIEFEQTSDPETLVEFLNEAKEHLETAERATLRLEREPDDAEQTNAVFRAFHTIKGVAGFLGLGPIVRLAHAAETLLDQVRSGAMPIESGLLDLVLESRDILGQLIEQLSGGPPPTRGELAKLVYRLGEAANGRIVSAGTREPRRPAGQPAAAASVAAAPSKAKATHEAVRVEQTVKVATSRLDSLLNLMGELVISQLMVVQDPAITGLREPRVQRNLGHMAKIVRDLHEVAMFLRMVPVRPAFQRMSRLVRDLSSKSGKEIDLVLEGEETELDRTIVDQITDPLVHMVRNACDHGIEPAEARTAAGKPAKGTLTLRAFHRGGMIWIEIEDDGRGLQRDRILKKCIERGLISADRPNSEISDAEVFGYVFLPGFSTAEKVTDISGRGVGMDVVKRNIEALRGKVEIRSTPGRGSTFSIQLPLTMAIIDGMVVRVGSQRYVVPMLAIECPFKPKAGQIQSAFGRGEMALFRGQPLPIHRLNRVFGIAEGVERLEDGLLIVIESAGSRCCLFVDEILGQQQVVIKNLGNEHWRRRGVSGGAILGDGRVALILDVGGLMQEALQAA